MPIRIRIKNKGSFFELIKYHIIFYTFCSVSACQHTNSYRVTKVLTDFSLGLYNNLDGKEKLLKGLKNNMNTNLKNNYCKCYESMFDEYKEFEIDDIQAKYENREHDVKISYDIHYSLTPGNSAVFSEERIIKKEVHDRLNSTDKKLLSKLLLIYGILGFETGQFWGLHPEFYRKISENYEKPMECFASPFNHNLKKYYSPVPKIDKHFGSKGNFFKKFLKSGYDCYVMNPPFVEDIMKSVFDLSVTKLDTTTSDITIFYYLPNWQDMINPFMETLEKKGHYCRHHVFHKNETFVYDYINSKKYPNVSFELILIQVATSKKVCGDDSLFTQLINILNN